MKIAFRVDASVEIGTGHVMRCLTLANALRQQGHECRFICRAHPGHLGDVITQKGFILHVLDAPETQAPQQEESTQLAHADWLGCPWQADAEQTLACLANERPDWLVVDHYALDARWERRMLPAVGRIMVIDDLADREHECAVLLDQNIMDDSGDQRYREKVNSECQLLLGPKYALLRPEYAALAEALPERDGTISRVLIFVGGSDPYHLTEKYLEALSIPEFQHLFVDVVVGKNHPAPSVVKNLVASRSRTRLYANLPSLAALMVRADLMFGAGGSTNWERMCLGLNSVVTSVAENQNQINKELSSRGLVCFLGTADEVGLLTILNALKGFIGKAETIAERSEKMRAVVDGLGCRRFADILLRHQVL